MTTPPARDLRQEPPRSPFATVGGYPWLPRMLDKVRATLAGTLGDYLPFPCPADQRFLTAIGLPPDAVREQVAGGAEDEAIAAWMRARETAGSDERLAAFRAYLTAPSLPERQAALQEAKAALALARPDLDLGGVDSFIALICAEEGHERPVRETGPGGD